MVKKLHPESSECIEIIGDVWWFKVFGMLLQNWAIVQQDAPSKGVIIYFVDDNGKIFDQIDSSSAVAAGLPLCESTQTADFGLHYNGFRLISEDAKARSFLRPPVGPFKRSSMVRPIYSRGEYWVRHRHS